MTFFLTERVIWVRHAAHFRQFYHQPYSEWSTVFNPWKFIVSLTVCVCCVLRLFPDVQENDSHTEGSLCIRLTRKILWRFLEFHSVQKILSGCSIETDTQRRAHAHTHTEFTYSFAFLIVEEKTWWPSNCLWHFVRCTDGSLVKKSTSKLLKIFQFYFSAGSSDIRSTIHTRYLPTPESYSFWEQKTLKKWVNPSKHLSSWLILSF